MSSVSQAAESVLSGCAASCGAVLVVAGAGKLYRGTRGLEDMTAVRRALRMAPRPWRLFGLAAGGAECAAGAVVCSGRFPVPGGAALAVLGAVFCALLGYLRVRKIPGDCGCIGWRAAARTAAPRTAARAPDWRAPDWRAMARGAVLLGVGLAYAAARARVAGAPGTYWWFGGGAAAGMTVLVLLSAPGPVRTPVCGRPLWRRTPATLRALARHETFAAMADSAGPFGPVVRHRRLGCTDEFWFTVPPGQGSQAVVFRVRRVSSGARLAVHTSLRDITSANANLPARAIAGSWGETL